MSLDTELDEEQQRLLQIVKELQSNVTGYERKKEKVISSANIEPLYPKALSTTEAKNIGIILDEQYSVTDLVAVNKIIAPDKLYWMQITTYDEFKTFLETKGIPAYISFNGHISRQFSSIKGKGGYQCAKLLIEECKKKKVPLPAFECHCPVTTLKQEIELLLFDYNPPK
jgi:hypothetical protein